MVLVPVAAVGAVGVPVNDGDAIVALSAIALVFDVILFVFVVTLVSKAAISFSVVVTLASIEVILEVLVAISFVLAVILTTFAAMLDLIEVILAVFEVIEVGKLAIVEELTPPTLTTVGAVAVPPKSLVN